MAKFQSPSLRGSGRFQDTGYTQQSIGRSFQSPSLRGSGRFQTMFPPLPPLPSCFNPLHCGAVVASAYLKAFKYASEKFQSPSLRGSGRFPRRERGRNRSGDRFNPLHCGAVVASGPRPERSARSKRFNPLHCGAVVASAETPGPALRFLPCFNPLHCGAVVASREAGDRMASPGMFQSPSLRGSGRFAWEGTINGRRADVSIPFIAGQWSLRGR